MNIWPPTSGTSGFGGDSEHRRYCAWRYVTLAELDTAIVAEQLGHKDGGRLVEPLCRHPDKRLRRAKIRDAFKQHATVRSLRAVRKDESD